MALTSPAAVPDTTSEELVSLLARQRADFRREGSPSAEVRRTRIDLLLLAIMENAEEIARALEEDFGSRPTAFSLNADVMSLLDEAEYVRTHLESWMSPVEAEVGDGLSVTVEKRPKGVVGVIGPWNAPVRLTVQPAVDALAAGNRVMIKFSDFAPHTGEVFARAVADKLPPEVVTVVLGGRPTAEAFTRLEFDHIMLTGSPQIGRIVAAEAGRNLVPVTLELGGKNPVVIARDADLADAAGRVAASRLNNGGQVCLCPDYVFVPQERIDEFSAAYASYVAQHYPDYADNAAVISLINEATVHRITGLVDDAAAKGARVETLATDEGDRRLPDIAARRIAPTLVYGVTDEMAIAHEEIFGPVLVVLTYTDLDEAIDYIESRPHPLVAYYYGDDGPDFREFVRRTTSGAVNRNDMALHLAGPDIPFGGIGQSGMGTYRGRAGFDTFTYQRPIASSSLPFSVAAMTNGPFTAADRDDLLRAIKAQIELVRARL